MPREEPDVEPPSELDEGPHLRVEHHHHHKHVHRVASPKPKAAPPPATHHPGGTPMESSSWKGHDRK